MRVKNIIYLISIYFVALCCAYTTEINGLVGEYYANPNLEGVPVYRVDENLNFNWGSGSPMPEIPSNNFSVRWTGHLEVPEDGDYIFSASIDDGIRIYVDDEIIFDFWNDSDTTRISSPVFLSAGKHKVRVEYYEANSGARIILSWKNSSSDYVVIPKENFYYDDSWEIPTITVQPQNKDVPSGRWTNISTDTEEGSVYFQWQSSADGQVWSDIPDAILKNYRTPIVDEISEGQLYRCKITNALHPDKVAYTDVVAIKSVLPEVFYVSAEGSDENDGRSWNTPFVSLQKAIDEAEKISGGNIWIKKGTYDFGSTVTLKSGVWIYGGFSGTEGSMEERADGNETIISGGGTHRIFSTQKVDTIKLENLVLSDGKAEQSGITTENSAIYIYASQLELKGVSVRNNSSDGQIGVHGNSTLTVVDCNFSNNTGRAINGLDNSKISISGSTFEANAVDRDGGAITTQSNCVISISDSKFIGNKAGWGGAISHGSLDMEIRGCEFFGNESVQRGGAIYSHSDVNVFECEFVENRGDGGGAVFVNYGNGDIQSSTFFKNVSTGVGGGIGIYNSKLYCANVTISGNVAKKDGGAIFGSSSGYGNSNNVHLINSTLVDNYSESTSKCNVSAGYVRIENSIIWGNRGYLGNEQLDPGKTVVNSVIEGGYEGGTKIITENPLLMPLDYYGGRVKTIGVPFGSCALNAGATQEEIGIKIPDTDTRGADRTAYERSCIGAFEPQPDENSYFNPYIDVLFGDDFFLEDYEFILELVYFETRILDTDDLLVEWYKNGELFHSGEELVLSDMLSDGHASYQAEMTLNGKTYLTDSFDVKSVPSIVYISNAGDDSNDGKTLDTAKRSLDAILSKLPYGTPFIINVVNSPSASSDDGSDTAFAVLGKYEIPDGVTLNIGEECVIKFADGAGFDVLTGGSLIVGNSSVFTHIADDSIGGDSNADGNRSLPKSDKYAISGGGNIDISDSCDWRYKSFEYGGTLTVSQIWQKGKICYITSDIIIPNGISLNIQNGAILKFAEGKRITVEAGGELFVNGTFDNPVVFTSIKDDTHGGDTNGDGNGSSPSRGDWKSLQISGNAEINYANFYYGGNTDGGSWSTSQGGAIVYLSGSSGMVSNCGIYDVKYDGILNYAYKLTVENTTIAYCSRFINSLGGSCNATNCVFYYATGASSGGAVLAHGGSMSMTNCVVSNVTSGAFTYSNVECSNNLFYNPQGMGYQSCSQVGSNGNLWGDPQFRNSDELDFTLKVGSPCIDAGAGEFAPELDYFGQPRVQDSHVSGVGTPCDNGAIPDIGIHEMTENAASEVDIAANWIKYPESVAAGDYADIVWMGTNVGSKNIRGNCTTTLFLVNDFTFEELELGSISNLINLAPSESGEFSAKVKIPNTVQDGAWKIKMVANSNRGIFEGRNTDNNTVVGDASINVEMPAFEENSINIDANSSAVVKFASSAYARSILVSAPEGLKIYGGMGYVPDSSKFLSAAVYCGNGLYALTIPASSESFYVTFVNESINSKTALIEVGENSLSILGTSIDKLPNNGNVTFSIYGSGFSNKSTVTVSNSNGSNLPTSNVKFVSENELSVTLSPEYAQAGDYELIVNDGINETAYDKHMTVIQTSKGPILETETTLPKGARAGRIFSFTVKCRNVGDANLDIPMVTLRDTGDEGLEFSLDGENFKTGEIKFLSLDNNGGFDAIEAGKEAITTVYCRVPSDANEVKISTRANTQNDIMAKYTNEVDELIDSDLINSEAPEVQMKLKKMQNVLGATNGEYIKNLTDIAKKIAKYAGNIQDVEMLNSMLISEVFKEETITNYNTNNLADKVLLNASSDLKPGKDNLPSETKYVSLYLWNHGWQPLPSLPQEKNKKIIILAHGMNDTISNISWCNLAACLSAKHPNAYIIGVDWKEKASTYVNSLGKTEPVGLFYYSIAIASASWTPIVAVYSSQILINSNISMNDDIITIGHSHGGHVSGRIANYFNAKRHIGLDTSTLISHKYDEPFYPKNIGITEYYRSSKLGGRDDAYADKNYIIVRNGDFEDDLYPEPWDDFVWDSRHGYAVNWLIAMVGKYGLDFDKKFDISDQTESKINPRKGAFVGIINSDEEFECIYPYKYDDSNTASISYPGQQSSWYYMHKSWRGAFDVSRNGTILSSIKENDLVYTGETKKLRIVGFQELSNKKSLVAPYDGVKYAAAVYLNVLDENGNRRATIELGKSEFENIGDFEVDMQIPHSYSDSYGTSIAVIQGSDSLKMTLIVHVYAKHGGIINNYICYDVYPNDNFLEIPIRIKQGENPVAAINGYSEDGFIITKRFEYTQEKYDSLKSNDDTTTSFKLNGDTDLSPEKNPIESWFWHNKAETQDTSIEISKVDSGRYSVALIVKDSSGKYDSVSGFVEVKVFVDGEEKETPLPESLDPNEMSGPAGVGDDRKVLPGQWLDFKIHFENKSDATAAAQEIHITNMLSKYLDWNTFELGEIVFKNQIVTTLSGKKSGTTEVALADGSQNVRLEFRLDPSTGKAYWYMRSVDRSTADGWPLNPYAGFLPPNDSNGNGEGYVAYRIKVRDDAPNAVSVDSSAMIVFDYNEPIETDPSWTNTVYIGAPGNPKLADVGEIINGSVALSWSAADFASSYDIYAWENGTERPSEALLSGIQGTSITFDMDCDSGKRYNFLVVAKNKYGESMSETVVAESKKVATYSAWSAKNLSGYAVSLRGKNAYSCNDNISNFEKYVFGLSAQKSTSYNENMNFYSYVGDDGIVRVRYPKRIHMGDASVRVSYSSDLKTWETDGISSVTLSDDGDISINEAAVDGPQPKNIWFKVEAVENN